MVTTKGAARAAQISRKTLNQWIKRRWFRAPAVRLIGGRGVRVWSARDIERLRRYVKANFLNKTGREPYLAVMRREKR
jgi:hypothetical protein